MKIIKITAEKLSIKGNYTNCKTLLEKNLLGKFAHSFVNVLWLLKLSVFSIWKYIRNV